ncbi:TRMT1-like protein isoform X1 [Leucoraja erinacea]|uniref:TRMT1-like protein isoform X1 n=1 Tax=Leucoraja erinaceus TaxID=7782 RepID=UPI002458A884|nr:TRMT1-like protein isoform X1 [Leucoraja erinacea]
MAEQRAEELHQEDTASNRNITFSFGNDNVQDVGSVTPDVHSEAESAEPNFSTATTTDAQHENLSETMDPTSTSGTAERHISIQQSLADLKNLIDIEGAGKKTCPLCPEEKFKPNYSHKLRRHLQHLHWKVSIDFEGYRMCICHLACRRMKTNLNGEQVPVRIGAHYHCIVCSATIARRTDMISHITRHLNKGDTEASFTGASSGQLSSTEVMKEVDTDVHVFPNHTTPQKTDSFFNPKMKPNRQLIFCTLAVLAQERKPLECLDAFGATGIMGLQWAKHLGDAVRVTINDINEGSVKMIGENCHLNRMKVVMNRKEEEEDEDEVEENDDTLGTIEVTQMDANVLMHLRAFDFIHLDPFGTAINYFDATFRNVRNLGIVSVTSTDISTLYCKALNVTMRHYGCNIVRTEYYKEVAARMVIASMARAAARCNKGIEVLLAVALEHFVLVVVRVLRGPSQADESLKKIRRLIHCQWCEERVFYKKCHMLEESAYQQLPCDCHGSMPGKTAVELGPLWSGSLFNTGFLRRMLFEAVQHGIEDIHPLLKNLTCESECTTLKHHSIFGPMSHSSQEESGVVIKTLASHKSGVEDTSSASYSGQEKRKGSELPGNAAKRQKGDIPSEHPPFYYSIHRHSIRGMNIPKINKFLPYLTQAGFRVGRTHFDPTGIRTDATLAQLKAILMKYSMPTHTDSLPGIHSHASVEPISEPVQDSTPKPLEIDQPAEEVKPESG